MGVSYCKSVSVYREGIQILKIESVSHYLSESEIEETYTYNNLEIELSVVSEETDLYVDINSNECPIRIFQNKEYWFTLQNSIYDEFNLFKSDKFDLFKSIFFNNKGVISRGSFKGIFNANNYVGNLNLDAVNIIENIIEVESNKINYKEDFSYLLEQISDFFIDLISRSSSFLESRFSKSDIISNDNKNYYSTFAFIKNMLRQENIPTWIEYIEKNVHSKLESYKEGEFIWEVDDLDIDDYIDALMDESNNVKYSHPTKGNMNIPLKVLSTKYIDSIDTNENQFIKFFLEYIREMILDIQSKIDYKNKKLLREIENSIDIVDDKLRMPFFREISNMNSIPFNSQVLQKKYPYNKLFKSYNDILLAPSLSIDILDEQFCVGQKDVPKLYEYWIFIKIFDRLNSKYNNNFDKCNWIKYDKGSLNVSLNNTNESCVTYFIDDKVELKLYYQKKYSRKKSIYNGRAYSHELDPDISLELYRDNTLIGIIHFDAKYKVPKDKCYNTDDIDKMHTYKDAIIGTVGAYVLCLSEKSCIFKQEELLESSREEIIFPSVGALSMNINSKSEVNELNEIFDIVDKFIELASNDNSYGIFEKNKTRSYQALKRIIDNI